MKCPNEFVLSQYADGELPGSEMEDVAAHLNVCSACRGQVATLKAENRLLVESLQGIDLCEPELNAVPRKQPEFSGLDRLAAILIGAVILLRVGIGLIQKTELPSALQWLQPWSLSGLLNWIVNGLFYVIENGGTFMTTAIETAGFAILGFLILGCAIAVTRRAIRTKAILGLISLMFFFVIPSHAIDVRKAEKEKGRDVTVAANETVDDTIIAFADSVRINGTVTGDLIAFARNVEIQGTVLGNVIGFGQRIEISGNVDGDVIGFGQSVRADGQIGKNLWGLGQTVSIGRGARLNHNTVMFANNAYIDGEVGRDAMVYTTALDVGGRVGRDLLFRGAGLAIHASSVIGRDLDSISKSAKMVHIDPGVTIGGKKKVEFFEAKPSRYLKFSFYTRQALRLGGGFLMGLLLYWLIPGLRHLSLSSVKTVLTSGGIGFLIAAATPIAAIILAITLIGIPVALLLAMFWLLGLYLAKVVVAKCIGTAILGEKRGGLASILLPLLVGLIIVIVAVNLPYIGSILNFILVLIGFGALVTAIYRMRPAASQN
ncbi:MAG: zf-HC2 domain-containing protein [Acidobacteria bacterium]|nr:zf-HC2 domain-containing protein [Acidobacteriota bacterium]